MKKSRIAKLALMGASITALAATLTTSTYAWYVSNKVANVTGGTGVTGSADSDGSVLLSWNGTSKWGKTLTFGETGAPAISGAKLMPVHQHRAEDTNNGKYFKLGSNGYSEGTTAATANTDYIEFTLYAKTESADGVDVQVSFVVNNTVASASVNSLKQLAYVDASKGAPTGLVAGQEFIKDALDAMYIRQNYGSTEELCPVAGALKGTTNITPDAGGNAHTYYKNVAGITQTLFAEAPETGTYVKSAFSNIHLTQTATAITYQIFLEGGDVDCFNSCAGQTFAFEISYQVVENSGN